MHAQNESNFFKFCFLNDFIVFPSQNDANIKNTTKKKHVNSASVTRTKASRFSTPFHKNDKTID